MFAIGNNEPLPFNLPDELKAELRKSRLAAGYDDNGNKIMQPKVFTDSELSELIKNAEDASRLKEASHRATDALDRLLRLNKDFTIKFIKEYLGYLTPVKYDNKND